ncbi:GNAT family N-acetyltransferase [Paenibacillus glycanilyticus]|uniref:N-acetyltransferase n=1 Tax=Paenibacillus glycanilyticus TaxID=126569 RepID=A0ABQ6GHV0_9BACL|nr:GNAT family N-acetyltransferase [Paenibacillus glycanilyticus]GLX70378.1 N-acetyltransferase [Paenibacillus glycanilyticus]
MDQKINIVSKAPGPEEYLALRAAAGLSPRQLAGAKTAMGNSIFAVTLRDTTDRLIGMGRIIGDGGCFYQIVDIAVHPDYQGLGYGKVIMSELMGYLDTHGQKGALVSLLADVPADGLYKKFGFEYSAPASLGMYKRI